MESRSFHLLAMVLVLASSSLQPASSKPHNYFTDLESLVAFKSHVTDPLGILAANWTTNTSFCSWIGVSCSSRRTRVTAIRLFNMSLQGEISPHLSNLSFLYELNLSNNTLTGTIPQTLGQLRRLEYINLEHNFLSGPIPLDILNMTSITDLLVAVNNLSGALPPDNSLHMLPRLQKISLSRNRFTGDPLASFTRCRDLQILSLSENDFSGTIPTMIGTLSKLTILYLAQYQLRGTIPASLGNLTQLTFLDLGENFLTGAIPEELGNLKNLQSLALNFCNLTGTIPSALLNCSGLNYLDLSNNKLSGSVPVGIGNSLPLLKWFHVGYNQLTGGLEFISSLSSCRNLEILQIMRNNLGGVVPSSIGNLSSTLSLFYAFENGITGSIPAALGNLSGLTSLSLDRNELTGTIPPAITRLHSLQLMSLPGNRIIGPIPSEIGSLINLYDLDLGHNAVAGSMPDSIANISRLQYLYLNNNQLSSGIPHSIWSLESLIELDLSVNSLGGEISARIGNLKALTSLTLYMNRLSGNIPNTLGELLMLATLDLSKNSIRGEIPETFGGLTSVTYLNLSYNLLSGDIPNSLANLPYLDHLDLSFNKLEGKIPNGRVFLNLSIPSLVGNGGLCGAPQLRIPPCSVNPANDVSTRKLAWLIYALPLGLLGVALLVYICLVLYRRRKVKALASNTDEQCRTEYGHRAVSYQELVRATSHFNEANLIGKGAFGSVFRGCLDDGLLVAIKVLNLELSGASTSFESECQVLRMVRHRNLIKIISACSNCDVKALILQFMPNGSLEQWLHSDDYYLNLLQRLSMTVDVSLALEYLHHHHPHVVLHCDLKPANVLFDEDMVAHVSDFGIAKLLLGDSRSIASTTTPGTIGYIAPEYATTGTVSRMGDVYSFGILLLETFCGKKPTDAMFDGELNLTEWVSRAHPAQIFDVVDYSLVSHGASTGDNAKIYACLKSVIALGLLCSSYSPKERIPMTDVAARMQKIKAEYLSSASV